MDTIALIKNLRKQLHNIPEPSMHEEQTKQLLMDFLRTNTGNLEIVDRGLWFYAVRRAEKSAGDSGDMPCKEPFRWSENFGYYLKKTRGAFFGVGCGAGHAGLHTPEYEFNDGIMETVLELYKEISFTG